MAQRLQTVYESEVHPEDRELTPYNEWLKENVIGAKGTTGAKIRSKIVPQARKILNQQEQEAAKAPPPKRPTAEPSAGEPEGPTPAETANELVDRLNNLPDLFTEDSRTRGKINTTTIANNESMANRYRNLRRIEMEYHDPKDDSVRREIDKTMGRREFENKIEFQKQGVKSHLPKNIMDKLKSEHTEGMGDFHSGEGGTEYHGDEHKKQVDNAKATSADTEKIHDSNMEKIRGEGVKHDLFNSDQHHEEQTLKKWDKKDEAKFQASLDKNATKQDIEKARREQGIPPSGPKPRLVKDPKTQMVVQHGFYLWHAGTHHWVTPEYMKVHGDTGRGVAQGEVMSDLYNKKDSKGHALFTPEGVQAEKGGIAGIMGGKNQGSGEAGNKSNIILANANASKNEHNHTTYENDGRHRNDSDAEHSKKKAHYIASHIASAEEGKGQIRTRKDDNVTVHSSTGTSALSRYGARMKAAGGAKGALARFVGTITPESVPFGIGKIGKQPGKYDAPVFEEKALQKLYTVKKGATKEFFNYILQ